MNAYSEDLRLRVLAAVERGISRKEVSRLFGVSLATIGRYIRRKQETGAVAPRPSPGRTPTILATPQQRRALWAQLEANSEATLVRPCALWEEKRGVRVAHATKSRAIAKLGWKQKERVLERQSATKKREKLGE